MSPPTLIHLPREIQIEIFEYLLVLETGACYEDVSASSASKEPSRLGLIRCPEYSSVYTDRAQIWPCILRVHPALTPAAEYVLYSQNVYFFNTPATVAAFNKRSSPYGLTHRSVHLQYVYFNGDEAVNGTSAWIPYIASGSVLKEMPNLKFISFDLIMEWEEVSDEEEGAEL